MAARNRQSFLNYEPISFSLTEGTNIPPPEASPPSTANGVKPADHQTEDGSTRLKPEAAADTVNGSNGEHLQNHTSAANGGSQQTSPARPQSVRRLFSLSSLRSSFSSSRASLSLPQDTNSTRPTSPSASLATGASSQINGNETSSNKLTKNNNAAARPQSRSSKRTGGSWFKRKSGLWNAENGLASIGEDGPDSKRLRDHSPAPLLPEIRELAGGDLQGGEVEWDEKLFKNRAQ